MSDINDFNSPSGKAGGSGSWRQKVRFYIRKKPYCLAQLGFRFPSSIAAEESSIKSSLNLLLIDLLLGSTLPSFKLHITQR